MQVKPLLQIHVYIYILYTCTMQMYVHIRTCIIPLLHVHGVWVGADLLRAFLREPPVLGGGCGGCGGCEGGGVRLPRVHGPRLIREAHQREELGTHAMQVGQYLEGEWGGGECHAMTVCFCTHNQSIIHRTLKKHSSGKLCLCMELLVVTFSSHPHPPSPLPASHHTLPPHPSLPLITPSPLTPPSLSSHPPPLPPPPLPLPSPVRRECCRSRLRRGC